MKGKVAIVTGASRGIGLGIAQALVDRGAQVCITARKPEALESAVAELGGADNAMYVAGKADDTTHQDETVARVLEAHGRIDMLVNNAGINPVMGNVLDTEPAAIVKIINVNLLAPIEWTRRVHKAWMAENGGSVVNVASITGQYATPFLGAYAISKAALIHLTKQLGFELGPKVRVNAVAPAVVKTQFAQALYEGDEEKVTSAYPLKRLGIPSDVGQAVAFLLSEQAAWITGETITLDGGVTLANGF